MRPLTQRHICSLWVTIVWLLIVTVENESAQECGDSALSGKLLVATSSGGILVSSAKGEVTSQLPLNPHLDQNFSSSELGLAYDPNQNSIYLSKALSNEIHRYPKAASWIEIKPVDNPSGGKREWMPCSLALDVVTSRLYVGDCIGGIVAVVQDAGSKGGLVRRTVLLEGLDQIVGMAIDQRERLLFVVDKYKIHRIDLDGANHQVILAEYETVDDVVSMITSQLPAAFQQSFASFLNKKASHSKEKLRKDLKIGNIALDSKSKRLLFINTESRRIESMDYNGGGRKLYHREARIGRSDPEDFETAPLTILDGAVYWTDATKKVILRMDLDEGKKSRVVLKTDDEEIRAVIGIECNENKQQIQNPCGGGSAQCQHMCVRSRSRPKGYRCLCDIGYEVAQDGRSCTPIRDLLIYREGSYPRAKGLDSSSLSIRPSTDLFYPTTFPTGFLFGAELDLRTGSIYWSGSYPNNKIHERRANSTSDKIIRPDLLSSDAARLAYDWITGNLYYFTYYYANFYTLSVLNTNDPSYSKIILENVTGLVAEIDVHPAKGYVFFAQSYEGKRAIISRVNADGTGLMVVAQMTSDVQTLAVDREDNRIYWTKAGGLALYHTDLNGRDRRQVTLPEGFTGPSAMSFRGKWLYAIVSSDSKIVRMDKLTGASASVLVSRDFPNSISPPLRLVSGSTQSPSLAERLCGLGRHDCAKFCFAVPDFNANDVDASNQLRRQCGCPYGQALATDGRSCVDDSRRQPAFLPCKYSFKCDKMTQRSA